MTYSDDPRPAAHYIRPLGRYGHCYRLNAGRYRLYWGFSVVFYLVMAVLAVAVVLQRLLHLGDETFNPFYLLVIVGAFGIGGQLKIASGGEKVKSAPERAPSSLVRAGSAAWRIVIWVGIVFLSIMLGVAVISRLSRGLPLSAGYALLFAVIVVAVWSRFNNANRP